MMRIMVDDDGAKLVDASRRSIESSRSPTGEHRRRRKRRTVGEAVLKVSSACRLIFYVFPLYFRFRTFAVAIGLYSRSTCHLVFNKQTSWQAEHPRNEVGRRKDLSHLAWGPGSGCTSKYNPLFNINLSAVLAEMKKAASFCAYGSWVG